MLKLRLFTFLLLIFLFDYSSGQIIDSKKIIDSIFCKPKAIECYKDKEICIINFLNTDDAIIKDSIKSCISFRIFNDKKTFTRYLKKKKVVLYLSISKHIDDSSRLVYSYEILKLEYDSYIKHGLSIWEEFGNYVYYVKRNNMDWKFDKIIYSSYLTSPTMKEIMDSLNIK